MPKQKKETASSKYQISETAEMVHVTANTLRYYNDVGLLAAKRKKENNYREFGFSETGNLSSIVSLRSMGIPIEKIQAFFESSGDLKILGRYLSETQENLQKEIEMCLQQQRKCANFYAELRSLGTETNTFSLQKSPRFWFVPTGEKLDIAKSMELYTAALQLFDAYPTHMFILPRDRFLEKRVQYSSYGISVTQPCNEIFEKTMEIVPTFCARYLGLIRQDDSLDDIYDLMLKWIQKENLRVTGDVLERFILGTPELRLMEFWIPVCK